MRSTEQLRNLYHTELKDQLAGMEKERIRIKRLKIATAIFGFILFLILQNIYKPGIAITIGIIGVIIILAAVVYIFMRYTTYRNQFKQEVVSKIIKLINPEYQYDANRHIDMHEFNESNLFSTKAERCQGDDYVEGKIESTDFKFSELNPTYKVETREDGKTTTEWHSIYRGLFFHADFNKHIQGTTFVLPDKADRLLGIKRKNLKRDKENYELVNLENPEFEKIYDVYGSSQVEARYILTPAIMEAMVTIAKKYGRNMYFSFKGERLYCAVLYNKPLFEPRIKKSGVNYADVEEMFHLFGLIETIIHEMNLNTRIWTKE
ncbi:MAG TPA: DUF3137 domain-containing protein [Bacteroidales bacterium]|nr:DUF3137 domain-containing protein [Bacteroidales bacterium]